MSDPVAEFLAREDGVLDDDIVREPAPAPGQNDFNLAPVQNGIHHGQGGDSGVDLAAQDVSDNVPPLSNGHQRQANSTPTNVVREEHETIKKWREEHAKLLKEKDDAELKQKQALHKAAKEELEQWKKTRIAEIAERKKKNREIEQKLQKEPKTGSKNKDSWTEIAGLVDTVTTKTASKTASDTSRMKTLIIGRKTAT